MSTRSIRLLVVLALLCSLLPLTAIQADAPSTPSTAPTSRLEALLIAHDVRHAIQLPRANSSDCLQTEAERGR